MPTLTIPGHILVRFIACLEVGGIPCVYLRNYDNLPEIIGNDADLLIPPGTTSNVLAILAEFLSGTGWHVMRVVEFGPMAVFVSSDDGLEFFHIDLFERLDWHCIPFADPLGIFRRRVWNGTVHRPAAEDEVYLNVMTRLIYQGIIREKHRTQHVKLYNQLDNSRISNLFIGNLGQKAGANLLDNLRAGDWTAAESSAWQIRTMVVVRGLFVRPVDTATGILSYIKRSITRLIKPPGIFVVFEGADGVGKSSIIDRVVPSLIEMTGKSNPLIFHWKPCKASFRQHGGQEAPPMNPRSKQARGLLPSLCFLFYHWLGFWFGWFRYLRPALVKNRAVLGDRYSYEFYLDPARLRLSCPEWLLKMATRYSPRPELTIALTADPSVITIRKKELGVSEILNYQDHLKNCALSYPEVVLISAEESLDKVVKVAISTIARDSCTRLRSKKANQTSVSS